MRCPAACPAALRPRRPSQEATWPVQTRPVYHKSMAELVSRPCTPVMLASVVLWSISACCPVCPWCAPMSGATARAKNSSLRSHPASWVAPQNHPSRMDGFPPPRDISLPKLLCSPCSQVARSPPQRRLRKHLREDSSAQRPCLRSSGTFGTRRHGSEIGMEVRPAHGCCSLCRGWPWRGHSRRCSP